MHAQLLLNGICWNEQPLLKVKSTHGKKTYQAYSNIVPRVFIPYPLTKVQQTFFIDFIIDIAGSIFILTYTLLGFDLKDLLAGFYHFANPLSD